MFENITNRHGAVFDDIVAARRTVRAFSSRAPGRQDIEAVIQAGLQAPFAALAVVGKPDFRQVRVLRKGTEKIETAAAILRDRIAKQADRLEREHGPVPFVQRLKQAGWAPRFSDQFRFLHPDMP